MTPVGTWRFLTGYLAINHVFPESRDYRAITAHAGGCSDGSIYLHLVLPSAESALYTQRVEVQYPQSWGYLDVY